MLTIYVVIWGFMLLAGISSIWALGWSIQSGAMRQAAEQANSIFDALPENKPTEPTTLSTRGD